MGGTPGGGGRAPGGRGAKSGGGNSRQTYIQWFEAKLELAQAITPKAGEKIEQVSETERIRRAFGMSEWEPKPTLLYFHFPHEEDDEAKTSVGKLTKKQCKDLDDENVARWSRLYHCVEVDMGSSHAKLLKRFGAGEKPSFAIVDRDLKVIAQSALTTKKGFVSMLEKNLPKFTDFWKSVKEQLDEQKTALAEAKKLVAAKNLKAALEKYHIIRTSNLRIAKWWDAAVKDAKKLEKKLHQK